MTSVRIDGVLHEFSTIKGVVEDTTDIILNLKELLFKLHQDEPVTMRLVAEGEGEVTAGDFETPSTVEILNPDLHIATLAKDGRLELEVTVAKGRGYVSADRNKSPTSRSASSRSTQFHPGPPGQLQGRGYPGRASIPTSTG